MADELSDAVARFVLEAGSLKNGVYLTVLPSLPYSIFIPAKAGLRAYAKNHTKYSVFSPSPHKLILIAVAKDQGCREYDESVIVNDNALPLALLAEKRA